jgi:acyl-CoA carboxylase epsilon subunit
MFHVKRGDPTPEELAALAAVLAVKARAATAARSRRRSAGPPPWGSPAAAHRQPLPAPGPGVWKRAVRGGVGWAGGGEVGRLGGGLWTAPRPSRLGPLGSPTRGLGSAGWGSRAPGVAGPTGVVGPPAPQAP